MGQAKSTSGGSGWGWNAEDASAPQTPRRRPPKRGGILGAALASVAFFVLVGGGVATYFFLSSDDGGTAVSDEGENDAPTNDAVVTAKDAPKPADSKAEADADPKTAKPAEAPLDQPKPPARSLETVSWTTVEPITLKDLSRDWSTSQDTLKKLNPKLAKLRQIEAGTKVVIYSRTFGASFSVGPPNNGKLTRGVPLPEGKGWHLPVDRTRAFATVETIASVTAGLDAYAQRFPEAEPIQMGDLSARRGGQIFGHQSHQSGLDVDIRLVRDASGEGFNAERNWFLVKTLIAGGDVRAIFLNNTEQTWLRAAAVADVGAAAAEEAFSLIRHEPGHTIHTHVRFACPDQSKRCVPYPLPDTDEQDPKGGNKLPSAGGKPTGGKPKLPNLSPKKPAKTPTKTPTKKKKKKKKKKGKKKG